jgi:hypothetical protein
VATAEITARNVAPATAVRDHAALAARLRLNCGIALCERNASSLLVPFVNPEIGLACPDVGVTAAALASAWATNARAPHSRAVR